MSSSDVDTQFQLEQHANSLEKKLRRARRQLSQTEGQLESAEAAAQAFSEQLDTDRQLQSINELWQQLQDAQAARAAAEQKQAEQQMQDVHAETMLAEMREQLEADKAERACAVSKLDEALQSEAGAAQELRTSNFALKAKLEDLKQKLVAETSQRSDLHSDLQRAQQQATSAADMKERLTAAQQQLAAVTAERDELQHEKQAWQKKCEDMRTAAKGKDEHIFILTNRNLAAADAVKKAHKERENQAEQAADLSVQLERFRAEMAELRRSSAAQISCLQAEHLNYRKIGAVHSAANLKHAAQKSVHSTKVDFRVKMQSGSHAAVGSGTMATARKAAAAAASKTQVISKGSKLTTTGKVVGSAQHVQAAGKSAIIKTSTGTGAVSGSKAAAQGKIGTTQSKQSSSASQKKTQASSAQAGAAPGPGPRPATAAAAVNSGALPMDASLQIDVAAGCQIKGQPAVAKPVQTDTLACEQAELVNTAEASLSQNVTGAGSKRKRATAVVREGCQRRRL